jgi:hypothetical protein
LLIIVTAVLPLLPEQTFLYMGRTAPCHGEDHLPFLHRKIILVMLRGSQMNRIIKVIKKEIIGNLAKAARSRRS